MRLTGTESLSIELAGALASTDALRVPAPLRIEGDGRVSVLVLEMRGLGLGNGGLPPRFDYREVLYRLGVTLDGEPAWLALRCDLDRALVRSMAAAVIRYPVRAARIDLDEDDSGAIAFRASTDDDALAAKLRLVDATAAPEVMKPRRTFVALRDRLFEVPWDERAAPFRAHADVSDVEAAACRSVFGAPVTFGARAVVHRGRTHICGAARAVNRHS